MCAFLKQWCVLSATIAFLSAPLMAEQHSSTPSNAVVVFINNVQALTGNRAQSNGHPLSTTVVAVPHLTGTELLPHRATYAISLDKSYDPDIEDVSGTMTYEIRDEEDKWIYEQKATFFIKYRNEEGNEDTEQVSITAATWESKDGLKYNFYSQVKRYANQVLEDSSDNVGEIIQGEAVMATPQGEGVVTYQQPEGLSVHLPAGTLFPIGHLAALIKEAAQNHRACSHIVFDGTNEAHEAVEVNTIITPMLPKIKFSDSVPFHPEHGWLMNMAVYSTGTEDEESEPGREINQRMLPHGILAGVKRNFGDFDAKAELTQLEFFNPSGDIEIPNQRKTRHSEVAS